VLARGFSIVRRADGRLATRAAELAPGDALAIQLAEGQVDARVEGLG